MLCGTQHCTAWTPIRAVPVLTYLYTLDVSAVYNLVIVQKTVLANSAVPSAA